MNKLLSSLGLAIGIATVSLLAGCQLYFGDSTDRDRPDRPAPLPSPVQPGFDCDVDVQCAAGCFCDESGKCAEGGFCGKDADCGVGFECDEARSSCIPAPGCAANDECDPGSMCDESGKGCVPTCKCTNDAEAVAQGAGWCDEARGTCMPGTDPAGACTGALTCTTAGPKCADGEVPLLKDGCYTGTCRAITACEAPPICKALQHEGDCITRNSDCTTVYNGQGCTTPDGSACRAGDTNCSCTSFTFAACENKGDNATRVIPE
ncbi:MAG: hypothetical protein H7138_15650 [Myxococcales bacterium]|nr:hypothetical protein [Myxococcales bacterium]